MTVRRLFLLLAIFWLLAWVLSAPAASPPAEDWVILDKPGNFITALCATDEALWIGTEDGGLWRLDLKADPAKAEAWQQFTSKDTATDHVYGIAVDTLGRVWVGTVNQGVSVYNGSQWRNYDVVNGCSGERVFAIAADPDPKRGHVWIGTDHGLTCWSPDLVASPAGAKGKWRTYTQADGLPSQQVYAIAVAPYGRVWVGTECDGLAWADSPYDKWHPVRADAEKSGDAGEAPGGGTTPGLPSNLTNGLAVLRDGTTIVSTDYGLGIRRAGELAWTTWQGLSKQPYENYTRGLAIDPAGGLWIATRHKGLVRLDLKTMDLTVFVAGPRAPKAEKDKPAPPSPPSLPDDYVFTVAVTAGGNVWAGTYGGGLARLQTPLAAPKPPGVTSPPVASDVPSHPLAALPEPLGSPTLGEANAMLADLAKVPFASPDKRPVVVRLGDDWLTKGDWLGRYGRYWACCCAMCSPRNYIWGAGPEPVDYFARIGPNCDEGDGLRYWVHWLYTKNTNSLEMPPTYWHSRVVQGYTTADFTRRQAEWDDHAEVYPMSKDGPHLFCTLKVPAGLYYLSLYNFNKDGHGSANRFRDFRLSVKAHTPGQPLYEIESFEKQPELARARMTDFRNGVYKRFMVRGPTEVTFQVARNHSFCTILAGVFLDLVDEYPVPYFQTAAEWQQARAAREKEQQALEAESLSGSANLQRFRPGETEAEATARLFDEVERMRLVNPVWWSKESRPFYAAALRWTLECLRNLPPGSDKQPLYARAATCYYHLDLYEKWEAGQTLLGKTSARQIEKALRWDGITFSYQGKGYDIVTAHLRTRSPADAAGNKAPGSETQP